MNNSKLSIDSLSLTQETPVDHTAKFRQEEGELVQIIDNLQVVQSSKEWSSLKEKVFDPLVNSLERDLNYEAKKEIPDPLRLNRLAGELKWAERYSNLKKLEESFRLKLTHVRIKLYGKTE